MAAFYAKYPASVSTNPSVGLNGDPAPLSSTQVAGVGPDGDLHPISTDNNGNQNVNVISSAIPTGAATEAKQDTQIAQVNTILGRLTGALVPTAFDEISLTYTGDNVTTVEYKLATVVVKTLTLTYSGANLTNVVAS